MSNYRKLVSFRVFQLLHDYLCQVNAKDMLTESDPSRIKRDMREAKAVSCSLVLKKAWLYVESVATDFQVRKLSTGILLHCRYPQIERIYP